MVVLGILLDTLLAVDQELPHLRQNLIRSGATSCSILASLAE